MTFKNINMNLSIWYKSVLEYARHLFHVEREKLCWANLSGIEILKFEQGLEKVDCEAMNKVSEVEAPTSKGVVVHSNYPTSALA
jgi:hypothetical protein